MSFLANNIILETNKKLVEMAQERKAKEEKREKAKNTAVVASVVAATVVAVGVFWTIAIKLTK